MNIELNNFLEETVKNNTFCQTCVLNHNGICFFAYECIKNDFIHFLDNGTEE